MFGRSDSRPGVTRPGPASPIVAVEEDVRMEARAGSSAPTLEEREGWAMKSLADLMATYAAALGPDSEFARELEDVYPWLRRRAQVRLAHRVGPRRLFQVPRG